MISDMIVHDAHVTLISDIYDIQMVCLSSLSAEVVQYQPLHKISSLCTCPRFISLRQHIMDIIQPRINIIEHIIDIIQPKLNIIEHIIDIIQPNG